jgi:outer membrane protein assembly factor BamD (BamD/ComL family)
LPVLDSRENQPSEADDSKQPTVYQNNAIEEIRRVGDASLFNLAQEAFESGRLKNATSTLRKISSTSSFYSEAQALQARVENISNLLQKASQFYQKGQCANAIQVYQQILDTHKGMKIAAQGIARCKQEMPVPIME